MTAYDISGAIVWTLLGLKFWHELATSKTLSDEDSVMGLFICVSLSLASIYCIARCFGASQ